MEIAGIPVAQVTPMIPVAQAVGSNRIVRGHGIVCPLGDDQLSPHEERELRRSIVGQALDTLETEAKALPH